MSNNTDNNSTGKEFSVDKEDEFNVKAFNDDFASYMTQAKTQASLDEHSRVNNMSHLTETRDNGVRDVRLGDIPHNMTKAWIGLITASAEGDPIRGLTGENRLFYISLTIFIVSIIMYFFTLVVSDK